MDGKRNNIIDAYRGVAILAVVAFHYTVRWPELYGYAATYSPLFRIGKYGVHLFFVVSGLVITMTVLRSATPTEFAMRRAARLYPAFVACACLTFIAMHWGPAPFRRGVADMLASLTMDASLFGHRYVDGAYWSLAVEVKFYALVALSRIALGDRFWVGVLGAALLSALPLGETWAYLTIAPWWPYFLLGMAGWYFIAERRRNVALVLCIASALLYALQPEGAWPTAFIFGSALSMLALLWKAPNWNPWPIRRLAWLGTVSYSLYLLHQSLGVSLIAALTARGLPDVAAMVAAFIAMTSLALVSYTLVEGPGNRAVMRAYRAMRGPRVAEAT